MPVRSSRTLASGMSRKSKDGVVDEAALWKLEPLGHYWREQDMVQPPQEAAQGCPRRVASCHLATQPCPATYPECWGREACLHRNTAV